MVLVVLSRGKVQSNRNLLKTIDIILFLVAWWTTLYLAARRSEVISWQVSHQHPKSFLTIFSMSTFVLAQLRARKPFPEARKPAFKLWIDFGPEIGEKKSSAQITVHYTLEDLVGRQVAAVVNFPPRQIGPLMSEVLTLGFPDKDGEVVLFAPDLNVPNGGRLF